MFFSKSGLGRFHTQDLNKNGTASKGLLLSLTPKTKRKETPANVCTKLALQMQTYEMT